MEADFEVALRFGEVLVVFDARFLVHGKCRAISIIGLRVRVRGGIAY